MQLNPEATISDFPPLLTCPEAQTTSQVVSSVYLWSGVVLGQRVMHPWKPRWTISGVNLDRLRSWLTN